MFAVNCRGVFCREGALALRDVNPISRTAKNLELKKLWLPLPPLLLKRKRKLTKYADPTVYFYKYIWWQYKCQDRRILKIMNFKINTHNFLNIPLLQNFTKFYMLEAKHNTLIYNLTQILFQYRLLLRTLNPIT